jgi:hypothetical protein
MKQNIFILLIVSVMFISGCSPAAVNIPSVSESAQTNIPTILPENSPFVSPTIKPASTQVGSEDTILPLSTPWYDWQKEGVNTLDLEMGGCLTGDDKYMYFIPDYNVDNPTNNLYKANLDGSGRTLLDKGCNGNLIIENNTLYYLKDDGIYSINTYSL